MIAVRSPSTGAKDADAPAAVRTSNRLNRRQLSRELFAHTGKDDRRLRVVDDMGELARTGERIERDDRDAGNQSADDADASLQRRSCPHRRTGSAREVSSH